MKTYILVSLALLASSPALADNILATLDQPIYEVSHTVSLEVDSGIATYKVQRTFVNTGKIPDEAVLFLNLPKGAVATRLRARVGHQEFQGLGAHKHKAPTLLSWLGSRNLELRVFPVPVGGTATIEYTLSAPVQWDSGRWHTVYPKQDKGNSRLVPIILTVIAGKDHGGVSVDSRRVGFESPVVLRPLGEDDASFDYDAMTQIHIEPSEDVVRAHLGSTHLAEISTIYASYQVEVPARLSKTPESAHAVFVVDRSSSLNQEDLRAQIELMIAFAEQLPQGQLQVVLVDRFAKPLLNHFAVSHDFKELLHQVRNTPFELKNGSNLDLGIKLARDLLSGIDGPKYIIGFTGNYLRSSLDIPGMIGNPEITTHLIVLGQSCGRHDNHRLAGIAQATGGILVRVSASDELESLARHLVRPTKLEFVRIEGIEHSTVGSRHRAHPEFGSLEEGEVYQFTERFDNRPDRGFGTLHAKLWHQDVRVVPARSKQLDKATAGWVFAQDNHVELNEDEQMKLALYANAVSPVTSLLTTASGVRPTNKDLPWAGFGRQGGHTDERWYRCYEASSNPPAPRMDSILEALTASCREQYPGLQAGLIVHTTKEEIVHVTERSLPNPFGQCLIEGIWKIELPVEFREVAYSTQAVDL